MTTQIQAEAAYERAAAPGPGTWLQDLSHAPFVICRFAADVIPDAFREGFRHTFRRYGSLLDHLEVAFVEGFTYLQIRPVGAPPEAVGHPPREVFEQLLAVVPELRERCETAEAVWAERRWRQDVAAWDAQVKPALIARREALDAVDLAGLSDEQLAAHVAECQAAYAAGWVAHHSHNSPAVLPVGDLMVHAAMWAQADPRETLAALAGSSEATEGGGPELAALADAVATDAGFRALVTDPAADPAAVVADLAADDGPVGAAARAYLAVARFLPVDAQDAVAAPTTVEEPALILVRLRAGLAGGGARPDASAGADAAAAQLRARVPAEHRAAFDDLLAEARLAYRLRDERAVYGDRSAATVARRALLEAGRRLAGRGLLDAPDHAVDLVPAEIAALLAGTGGPSREEVAGRVRWRLSADNRRMPELFGPPPGEPLPAEWLPEGAARVHRAIGFAFQSLLRDAGPQAQRSGPLVELRGLGAGVGVREGTARVVRSVADLHRIVEGDILVAPCTGPAFNLVLPLLAGIVTDRGGLLSHAAIVAREFGVPAVVGCVDATHTIPDGARVRLDGAAGTVTVLP